MVKTAPEWRKFLRAAAPSTPEESPSMSVDTAPQPAVTGGRAVPDWPAIRRTDPEIVDRATRYAQQRVAGHLLGALRLSREQALELTEQAVLDALAAHGTNPGAEPVAGLLGTAEARLRDRLRTRFGDIPGLDVPFEPEADPGLLRAFYDGDRRVDRQLAHRRNLVPFLELVHLAVQTLTDGQRAVLTTHWALAEHGELDGERAHAAVLDSLVQRLGTDRADAAHQLELAPVALRRVSAALLLAQTRPEPCGVLDEHLRRADWQPGQPFGSKLRQRVLHHVGACPVCLVTEERAELRVGTLPPLLLWVVLGLEAQRRRALDPVFAAADAAAATTVLATGATAVAAPPGTDPAPAARRPGRTAPPPVPDLAEPGWSRRRVALSAALAVALLGLGVAGWRWAAGSSGTPARVPAASPTHGATPTGAVSTIPTGTASPAAQPSGTPAGTIGAAASTTPSGTPSATASATAAATSAGAQSGPPSPSLPTPSPVPGGPVHRLVIQLAALSDGSIEVRTRSGGPPGGTCSGSAACGFGVRAGDPVTLHPVNVVLSWGSGPCQGTGASADCTFTPAGDTRLSVWVLRGLGG
jgi:hypothetical protein